MQISDKNKENSHETSLIKFFFFTSENDCKNVSVDQNKVAVLSTRWP